MSQRYAYARYITNLNYINSNIYKEHELERETTCANFAHTKDYGRRKGFTQTKNIILYNLDVIISVGYRVKSQRGTQFRIWANRVLKEYLVKGYAVNKALTEQRYTELKQLVAVLGRTVKAQEALTSDDALNLVEVVSDYAYALDTLDKYDYLEAAIKRCGTGYGFFGMNRYICRQRKLNET